MSKRGKWWKFGLGGLLFAIVGGSAAIYAYIHFIKADAPPPLSLDSFNAAPASGAASSGASDASTTGVAESPKVGTCAGTTSTVSLDEVGGKAVVTSGSLSGTTEGIGGTVVTCDAALVSGTIDIDLSRLTATGGSQDALAKLFPPDDIGVATLTVSDAASNSATLLLNGEEKPLTSLAAPITFTVPLADFGLTPAPGGDPNVTFAITANP